MDKIPVKINLPLYIRKGPGRSYGTIGVAPASGKTIEMDGLKEDGDAWKGNTKWYYKINDKVEKQWYWGGRIEEVAANVLEKKVIVEKSIIASVPVNAQAYINERFVGNKLINTIDYNLLLNIDEGLKRNKGRGITVAILDHPIRKDINFKNKIIRPFKVDHPRSFHGSFIAGIIAGTSELLGIVPEVQIVELPIYDENGLPQDGMLTNALDFIDTLEDSSIINISQALPSSFETKIKRINKIVIASAGVNKELVEDLLTFPARLENVLAVGCVSDSFSFQNLNSKLDFLLPNFNYVSYSLNKNGINYQTGSGDSFSTAIVTSIVALLLSAGKIDKEHNNLKDEISKVSQFSNNKESFKFLNSLIPPK